jgi:ABC-2 type transport system permease protein
MTATSLSHRSRHGPAPLPLVAAFIRRDWKMARSYRLSFALQFVGSLSSLLLVYFLSRFMGHAISGLGGHLLTDGYFDYAAPALILLALLMTALGIFGRQLRTAQQTGTLETLLTTPTPPWLILVGGSCYELLFAAAAGLVTLALAMGAFGLRIRFALAPDGVALLAALGALGVFSAFGMLYAAFVVVFKGGTAVLSLLSAGVALVGGIYYPISVFPTALRILAEAIPLAQSVNIVRETLLFGEVPLAQLGILWVYTVVLVPLSLVVFGRAVRRARRQGTLGQY